MTRRNFAEILLSAKIDIKREYSRLYELFYKTKDMYGKKLIDRCEEDFKFLPFKGRCLSLKDFDETFEFNFVEQPNNFDLDYLISFCEYTYNVSTYVSDYDINSIKYVFVEQVNKVINILGYKFLFDNKTISYILVPENQEAIAVAEIVDEKIAYMTLEYNHHSMKGDLHRKKTTLKFMADDIEPQRKQLKSINTTLESQLFQMFHKFVRHNNEENAYIKSLTKEELESIYDDIYQMWLLAKLEIDNLERKNRVAEILNKAEGN